MRQIGKLKHIRNAMVAVLVEIDNTMNGEKSSLAYWQGLCRWWQCSYSTGDALLYYPGDVIRECVRSGRI